MKTGRNEKCPCGSGKKYKKCCLLKDENAEAQLKADEQKEWEEWFAEDCRLGQQRILEPDIDFHPESIARNE